MCIYIYIHMNICVYTLFSYKNKPKHSLCAGRLCMRRLLNATTAS